MLIIHNAAIVTVDAENRVIHGGAIAIDGNRILDVGAAPEILNRYGDTERIDGSGRAVFPGFANVHTHFYLTLARGIYEDLSPPHRPPFAGGLAELPLPPLSPAETRAMCRLGALEAIRSGTTAALEDSVHITDYAEAMAATGLRLTLTERVADRKGGAIGLPGPFTEDPEAAKAGLARIRALRGDWNGAADGRIQIGVSAHAPDMCSPSLLTALRDLQTELDTVATIHLNQIWGEVEAVRQARGRLPTEYLADQGFLSDRLIAAHCRCMAPEEEALLGAAGATVAFNSAIAARRGLSPNISDLEDAGALIAMGSDNMAEDMVEVMRTGLFMERVRRRDGRTPRPEDALRWATANGYEALGIAGGGSLEIGNLADLIVVNLQKPHLIPNLRVVSGFVHQGQASDIESVMVDGRWLMKDGVVLTMNEADVLAEADAVARNAWRALVDAHPEIDVPKDLDVRPAGADLQTKS